MTVINILDNHALLNARFVLLLLTVYEPVTTGRSDKNGIFSFAEDNPGGLCLPYRLNHSVGA